jgi:hypothetical protein
MNFNPIKLLGLCFLLLACQESNAPKVSENQDTTPQVKTLFSLANADKTNLRFVNNVEETYEENYFNYEFLYNGAGVAVGDLNNDGFPDIYFAGNSVNDKLYLNKGDLTFKDISGTSGIAAYEGWSTGVTMIDINADGWLDIYVCRSGPSKEVAKRTNRLFINNKDNTFTEAAADYGLQRTEHSIQSAFFDYDLDGDLDMYLLNHPTERSASRSLKEHMEDINSGKIQTDLFFKNVNGKFIEASKESGLVNFGFRHGIALGDINKDGYPDIYISSDFDEPDVLEINQGDGTFKNEINSYFDHISFNSMGNEMVDMNNDGQLDLFVVDMASDDHYRSKAYMKSMDVDRFKALTSNGYHHQYMFNTLQINNGDTSFSEVAQLSGIAKTDWSWGPLFFDMDQDGYKDLFITNGIKENFLYRDLQKEVQEKNKDNSKSVVLEDLLAIVPSDISENVFYKNKDGLSFEKMSGTWAAPSLYNSNGIATADFDNDGDLDFVTNNMGSNASLYISQAANGAGGNHIKLHLKGTEKNPAAIGAKVAVKSASHDQWQELYTTRGYLSAVDPALVFGLGSDTHPIVTITWPDGTQSSYDNLAINQSHILEYDQAMTPNTATENNATTLLQSVDNSGIDFTHTEDNFDDYKVQILLPHSQSNIGPAITTADVNQDGIDDLYIGGAAGQAGQLYLGTKNGSYRLKNGGPWQADAAKEDTGALFVDVDSDGDQDLYVVSGGAHLEEGHVQYQDRLYRNTGNGTFVKTNSTTLPELRVSGQSIAASDVDGDGDQDLFIGGRIIPDKYPYAPKSYLLTNTNGTFTASEIAVGQLVSQALFTDYDGDGDDDLMTVGEWSEIQIFENSSGAFAKADIASLKGTTGLWFGLAQKDIDGDGDLDYFAGNLGLNAKFKAGKGKEFHIFCDDFDGNGSYDVVLSNTYKGNLVPARGRECSSQQMPFITDKFEDYRSFASATLEDIYGAQLETALHYKADRLDSVFLENNGDGSFSIQSLPLDVQLSPISSFAFTDLNKDGKDEVILTGNLYNVEVETERYDALKGGVLSWTSTGFESLEPTTTGFLTKGDTRSVHVLQTKDKEQLLVARNNSGVMVFEKK